jgi:uncharacterized protein DUF6236
VVSVEPGAWGRTLETALYFPYIRVPETSWFTQVLLYWDNAASIVPSEMYDHVNEIDYTNEIGEYMHELIEKRLVRPISPDEFRYGQAFNAGFLELLHSYDLPKLQLESGNWTRLHRGKFNRRTFEEMERRGVATRLRNMLWWYAVESRTAELYMNYLVGAVCKTTKHFFPVTDTGASLRHLARPLLQPAGQLAEMRYVAITQALPVPSRVVPPGEIADFKQRYSDQLRRLRIYLNGHLADLAEIDDEYLRDAKLESLLQEIRDDVEILRERMARRRWPRIVLVGVAGLIASGAAIGAAVASGGTALALGLGVSGGMASLGPAGYQMADVARAWNADKRTPLAYAALAEGL